MESISYGKQTIEKEDIEEVTRVLSSDWISQGPKIREFESALAAYCGARYAVAVSSGTAALHLACLASGLGKGDEAVTTPISFVATANAVLYAGAKPVFADIDEETVNLDPAAVEKSITQKTRAILPVHFAGLPAEMKALGKIARKKNLAVIEDACHALGAEYEGRKIGSCQYSDMTVFSFHPLKHITTGEGGCITTNDKKIYEKLQRLRHHGISKSKALKHRFGGWYTEMQELGFNYRITDFQCALGLSQLRKLGKFLRRRTEIAGMYNAALQNLGDLVRLPPLTYQGRCHAWHLYLLRLNLAKAGITRRQLYDALAAQEIFTQVHYLPIYRHPFYRKLYGPPQADCPRAERYYQEVLSLPIFPSLTGEQMDYILRALKNVFGIESQVLQTVSSI